MSDNAQDKHAMAADNRYLLHICPPQNAAPASVTIKSDTLAVEHAAASDRNERICQKEFIIGYYLKSMQNGRNRH